MKQRVRFWSLAFRGLFVAAALVALGTSAVSASPDNKNTYEVEMTCPGEGAFTLLIVSPNSAARHIMGSTGMVILASVVGTATIDGVTYPLDFSPSEQRFVHQELTTCFVDYTFVLPKTGQSVAVDAVVQAILTPRNN